MWRDARRGLPGRGTVAEKARSLTQTFHIEPKLHNDIDAGLGMTEGMGFNMQALTWTFLCT